MPRLSRSPFQQQCSLTRDYPGRITPAVIHQLCDRRAERVFRIIKLVLCSWSHTSTLHPSALELSPLHGGLSGPTETSLISSVTIRRIAKPPIIRNLDKIFSDSRPVISQSKLDQVVLTGTPFLVSVQFEILQDHH